MALEAPSSGTSCKRQEGDGEVKREREGEKRKRKKSERKHNTERKARKQAYLCT